MQLFKYANSGCLLFGVQQKQKKLCPYPENSLQCTSQTVWEFLSIWILNVLCLIMASSFIYFNENLLSVLLEPDWEVCVQLRPQLAHQAGVGRGRASGQQPLV